MAMANVFFKLIQFYLLNPNMNTTEFLLDCKSVLVGNQAGLSVVEWLKQIRVLFMIISNYKTNRQFLNIY